MFLIFDHKNILPTTLYRMITPQGRVGGKLFRLVERIQESIKGMLIIPCYIKGSENIL